MANPFTEWRVGGKKITYLFAAMMKDGWQPSTAFYKSMEELAGGEFSWGEFQKRFQPPIDAATALLKAKTKAISGHSQSHVPTREGTSIEDAGDDYDDNNIAWTFKSEQGQRIKDESNRLIPARPPPIRSIGPVAPPEPNRSRHAKSELRRRFRGRSVLKQPHERDGIDKDHRKSSSTRVASSPVSLREHTTTQYKVQVKREHESPPTLKRSYTSYDNGNKVSRKGAKQAKMEAKLGTVSIGLTDDELDLLSLFAEHGEDETWTPPFAPMLDRTRG